MSAAWASSTLMSPRRSRSRTRSVIRYCPTGRSSLAAARSIADLTVGVARKVKMDSFRGGVCIARHIVIQRDRAFKRCSLVLVRLAPHGSGMSAAFG